MATTTNKLTPDQWSKLESTVTAGIPIYLLCDGYWVTLQKHVPAKGSVKYLVFVNGSFKGEWLVNMTEPEIKFLNIKQTTVYGGLTAMTFKKMQKIFGKREAAKRFPKTIKKSYRWDYPSFYAFKKRLLNTCTSIEIINN